jgi:hypothetical protein
MKYKRIALFSFLIITLLAFGWKCSMSGISGKGESVAENRDLSNFYEIYLSIDADVYYMQDSIYKVEVIAQQNILDVLETIVEGEKLDIDFKSSVWKHEPIKIYIHSPDINVFEVSGSGDIIAQNNIKSKSMNLKISGSGDIKIPSLIAEDLKIKISGSGDISVSAGKINNEIITITGSGNAELSEVAANSCEAKINGSGDILVNLSENLDARISGSGNIKYKGTPEVNSHVSGSGDVVHLR